MQRHDITAYDLLQKVCNALINQDSEYLSLLINIHGSSILINTGRNISHTTYIMTAMSENGLSSETDHFTSPAFCLAQQGQIKAVKFLLSLIEKKGGPSLHYALLGAMVGQQANLTTMLMTKLLQDGSSTTFSSLLMRYACTHGEATLLREYLHNTSLVTIYEAEAHNLGSDTTTTDDIELNKLMYETIDPSKLKLAAYCAAHNNQPTLLKILLAYNNEEVNAFIHAKLTEHMSDFGLTERQSRSLTIPGALSWLAMGNQFTTGKHSLPLEIYLHISTFVLNVCLPGTEQILYAVYRKLFHPQAPHPLPFFLPLSPEAKQKAQADIKQSPARFQLVARSLKN